MSQPGSPPGKTTWLDFLRNSGTLAISIATTFLVAVAICVFIASLFKAALARGAVIEAFAVPTTLADKGLTGQVLASELPDRVMFLQKQPMRAQVSEAKAVGSLQVMPPDAPIKVEISSTTITLDELYIYLRSWLGHERFISGELIVLPSPGGAAPRYR